MHIEWRDWQLNGIYARIKSVLLGWVAYHNKEGIGRQIVKELRIIVAGSRGFKNYRLLSDTIMEYLGSMDDTDLINSPSQVKFISGNAKGADVLGEEFAYTWGYDVVRFPADWDGLGKRAGYVRNDEMAKYSMTDGNYGVLIAFWDGKSKGTRHMIDLAKKNGLEVRVVRFDNAEIGK